MSGRIGRLVCALGLAGAMSACATLSAVGSVDALPALDTPEPPPRLATPLPSEPPDTGPAPVVVPVPPAPDPVPRPTAPRVSSERTDPPAPGGTAATESPTRQPAEDVTRGATLQTTPRTDEAERRVRDLITRASRDLGQIDNRRLNDSERTEYDAARRFVAQAEEALKAKNVLFAEQLADKAAELAAGLRD